MAKKKKLRKPGSGRKPSPNPRKIYMRFRITEDEQAIVKAELKRSPALRSKSSVGYHFFLLGAGLKRS